MEGESLSVFWVPRTHGAFFRPVPLLPRVAVALGLRLEVVPQPGAAARVEAADVALSPGLLAKSASGAREFSADPKERPAT